MASGAEVRGVDQLNTTFQGMTAKVSGQKLAIALRAGGLVIEVPTKAKAPVLTGNLRRRYHTEAQATGAHSAQSRTGTNVEYAVPVEFGTSHQQGQPHLRPAYDENKDAAVAEVGDVLRELTQP